MGYKEILTKTLPKPCQNQNFLKLYFWSRKKSKLRKHIWYNFDVKNCDLSIYEVFMAFWARQV